MERKIETLIICLVIFILVAVSFVGLYVKEVVQHNKIERSYNRIIADNTSLDIENIELNRKLKDKEGQVEALSVANTEANYEIADLELSLSLSRKISMDSEIILRSITAYAVALQDILEMHGIIYPKWIGESTEEDGNK